MKCQWYLIKFTNNFRVFNIKKKRTDLRWNKITMVKKGKEIKNKFLAVFVWRPNNSQFVEWNAQKFLSLAIALKQKLFQWFMHEKLYFSWNSKLRAISNVNLMVKERKKERSPRRCKQFSEFFILFLKGCFHYFRLLV